VNDIRVNEAEQKIRGGIMSKRVKRGQNRPQEVGEAVVRVTNGCWDYRRTERRLGGAGNLSERSMGN
jgi:hypothetical protein